MFESFARKTVRHSGRLALAAAAVIAGQAQANPAYWTVWTTADPTHGTAQGTITLPDASVVTVSFVATNANGTPGNFLGAYLAGGPHWNGWSDFASAYLSPQVSTIPGPTMLQLVGGQNETYTVTLGAPIVNPLMDIVSLGASGTNTHYDFSAPFNILSQGYDYWGGCPTCLTKSGNSLIGNEGSGTIEFIGTYSSFSWTVPTPEYWHGFTFGIETTQALQVRAGALPEPGSLLLSATALAGLALRRLRRQAPA